MAMPHEPTPSLVEGLDAQRSHTLALTQELFALSNNNPFFRSGRRDTVRFSVGDGDRVEDIDAGMESAEHDFHFMAERQRKPRAPLNVKFTFAEVETENNVPLPTYIASSYFDISLSEAEDAAGIVTHEKETKYTFDTKDLLLNVCHGHIYNDADDDPIVGVCSCPPDVDGVSYVDADIEQDDEYGLMIVKLDIPRQVPHAHLRERTGHSQEASILGDLDDAFDLWKKLDDIEPELEEDAYLKNLIDARSLLAKIKSELLRQAGVTK